MLKQCQCLSRIAWSYGFQVTQSAYEPAANESFRELHPNSIYIPEKYIKFEERSPNQRRAIVVHFLTRLLRLALCYEDKKPTSGTCGLVVRVLSFSFWQTQHRFTQESCGKVVGFC